jgi:hypothetical protein
MIDINNLVVQPYYAMNMDFNFGISSPSKNQDRILVWLIVNPYFCPLKALLSAESSFNIHFHGCAYNPIPFRIPRLRARHLPRKHQPRHRPLPVSSYTCIVSPLLSCILVRERRLTVEAKTYSCTEIVLFYHFELLRLIRYRM